MNNSLYIRRSGKVYIGADSSFVHDPTVDTTLLKGKLKITGSIETRTTIISSSTTLGNTNYIVFVTGASSYLVTLPSASTCTGRNYILKVTGGAKTISSFLDLTGSASTTLSNNTIYRLVSDGTDWQQL